MNLKTASVYRTRIEKYAIILLLLLYETTNSFRVFLNYYCLVSPKVKIYALALEKKTTPRCISILFSAFKTRAALPAIRKQTLVALIHHPAGSFSASTHTCDLPLWPLIRTLNIVQDFSRIQIALKILASSRSFIFLYRYRE